MKSATPLLTPNQCPLCGLHVTLHRGRHDEYLSCQQAADACRYAGIRHKLLRELMLQSVEKGTR